MVVDLQGKFIGREGGYWEGETVGSGLLRLIHVYDYGLMKFRRRLVFARVAGMEIVIWKRNPSVRREIMNQGRR